VRGTGRQRRTRGEKHSFKNFTFSHIVSRAGCIIVSTDGVKVRAAEKRGRIEPKIYR